MCKEYFVRPFNIVNINIFYMLYIKKNSCVILSKNHGDVRNLKSYPPFIFGLRTRWLNVCVFNRAPAPRTVFWQRAFKHLRPLITFVTRLTKYLQIQYNELPAILLFIESTSRHLLVTGLLILNVTIKLMKTGLLYWIRQLYLRGSTWNNNGKELLNCTVSTAAWRKAFSYKNLQKRGSRVKDWVG